MKINLHHAHIFASNIEKSISFYRDILGGIVIADDMFAGARNIFLQIGQGRLHLYDQGPKSYERGAIHHLGIQTDRLIELVARMKANGIEFKKDISDFGFYKYVMVAAPDGILLELFEVQTETLSDNLATFFAM